MHKWTFQIYDTFRSGLLQLQNEPAVYSLPQVTIISAQTRWAFVAPQMVKYQMRIFQHTLVEWVTEVKNGLK